MKTRASCGRVPRASLRGLLLAVAVLAACGSSNGGSTPANVEQLTVMTRNLYLGAPLDPLFAGAVTDLPAAVATLWNDVKASDPPGRMAKIADEIAASRPDVVALQEAALFQTTVSPAPERTEFEFVELIRARLQALGLDYRVVAQSRNFSQQLTDSSGAQIRFTDRDVLLARSDVTVTEPVENQHYQNQFQVLVGFFPISIPRGWCSVVVDRGAGPVRIVNTHLEAAGAPAFQVQEAQATELATAVAPEQRRVVLLGDFNSPADGSESTSYATLQQAGYVDSWQEVHAGDPGRTCCFDASLTGGTFTSRIDLVLHRGAIGATAAEIVGTAATDRTSGGMYPSDHAGVSAVLRLR